MGFKCPVCHKDFSTNKLEWKNHLANCNNGIASVLVKTVINVAEQKPKESMINKNNDVEKELRKLIISARNYMKKAQEKEYIILETIQNILKEQGMELCDFSTNHYNADNLEDAITCHISYGEYELDELMKEIKGAIKGGK